MQPERLYQSLKRVGCGFWQSNMPVLYLLVSHKIRLKGMMYQLPLSSGNLAEKSTHNLHSTIVADHERRNQTGKSACQLRKS